MSFLYFSVTALAIAYILEWRFSGKRWGLFAVLFWVFSTQTIVFLGLDFALQQGWASATPSWVNAFALAVGGAAYFSIGLTAIVAIFAGIWFVLVHIVKLRRHCR